MRYYSNKSYTSPYETSCNIVRLALSPKGNLLFLIDEGKKQNNIILAIY
jgi:hypothetical protein